MIGSVQTQFKNSWRLSTVLLRFSLNTPMTINPRFFFKAYLVDHFLYKQATLKNILDQYSSLKPTVLSGVNDVDDAAYLQTIRMEIRSTYFQSIETLFEMLFALMPRNGVIDNENLWYNISTSDWKANYKKISDIAKGDLSFLDLTVAASEQHSESFSQYAFFFGGAEAKEHDRIDASIPVVRNIIEVIAKDFSDRNEYNAIKHSIRLLPIMKTWEIITKAGEGRRFSFDLTNSMTFLREEPDGSLVHHTKMLDTERDFKMSLLVVRLISNLIRGRKTFFFKQMEPLYTFSEDDYNLANKSDVSIDHLSIRVSSKPAAGDKQQNNGT